MKIINLIIIFFIFFNKIVLAEIKPNGFKGSAGKFMIDQFIKSDAEIKPNGFKGSAGKFMIDQFIKSDKEKCEQRKKKNCKSLNYWIEHLKSLRGISDREEYLKKNDLPKIIKLKCSRNNNYDDVFRINMISRSVNYEAIGKRNEIISSTKRLHIEDSSIAGLVELSTLRKKKDNSYYLIFYTLDIRRKKLSVRLGDNLTEKNVRQWFGYHFVLVAKDKPKKYNCIKLANKKDQLKYPWVEKLADDFIKARDLNEYLCAKGDKKACNDVKLCAKGEGLLKEVKKACDDTRARLKKIDPIEKPPNFQLIPPNSKIKKFEKK